MAKGYVLENEDRTYKAFIWACPGCECSHQVPFVNLTGQGGRWVFNEDIDNPTLSPSVLVNPQNDPHYKRCHCFVRNGHIEFLSDCDHELAGKIVPVPNWEES